MTKKTQVSYVWQDLTNGSGKWIRGLCMIDQGIKPKRIIPSGLFRVIAKLLPTEDAVGRIANKYGFIGHIQLGGTDQNLICYELLEDWKHEILDLRCALELWEALKNPRKPDHDALHRMIRLHAENDRAFYYSNSEMPSSSLGDKAIELWTVDDMMDDFAVNLRQEVLGKNVGLTALRCLRDMVEEKLHQHAHPKMIYVPQAHKLRFQIESDLLLGKLWLQFAGAVSGYGESGITPLPCAICGLPIENATRRSQKYHPECAPRNNRNSRNLLENRS